MASVHIKDIQQWLADNGQTDANQLAAGGFFLEIRFDVPGDPGLADEDMVDRVIDAESPQGHITILFDKNGLLKSVELS